MCFEGEADLLTFQKPKVLLIFFGLKVFLALRPLGLLSSDTYFIFFCLDMILFQN